LVGIGGDDGSLERFGVFGPAAFAGMCWVHAFVAHIQAWRCTSVVLLVRTEDEIKMWKRVMIMLNSAEKMVCRACGGNRTRG
jgi:hypothetical protein